MAKKKTTNSKTTTSGKTDGKTTVGTTGATDADALRQRVAKATAKLKKQQAAEDRRGLFRSVLLAMLTGRVPTEDMLRDDYIPAAWRVTDVIISEEKGTM